MKTLRFALASIALTAGSVGFVAVGPASAYPSSITATATLYSPTPSGGISFPGQLAADPAGNLYIASIAGCTIYKVDVANPSAAATPLANTTGAWCGVASQNGYGLLFVHTANGDVLVDTPSQGGAFFEVPLDGVSAPTQVGTGAQSANLAYDAATDTLASLSFNGDLGIVTSFSTCTAASPCTASVNTISGTSLISAWGIAITGSHVLTQINTALLGQSALTGGTPTPIGPAPGANLFGTYLDISQNARGDVFVMDPLGEIWEVPAGTTQAIPFSVTGAISSSGYYAMVYSNGALYAFQNGGDMTFTKITFEEPTPPSTTSTTAAVTPTTAGLAGTGASSGTELAGSIAFVAIGAGVLMVGRRRTRRVPRQITG